MCPFTDVGFGQVLKEIKISSTGEKFQIKDRMTCSTKNCIYMITCTKKTHSCNKNPQYGGETEREVKHRCREHKATIANAYHRNTKTTVGQHFRSKGHSLDNFCMVPIEKIRSEDPFVRKTRERYYINKFNLIQEGLNKRL